MEETLSGYFCRGNNTNYAIKKHISADIDFALRSNGDIEDMHKYLPSATSRQRSRFVTKVCIPTITSLDKE